MADFWQRLRPSLLWTKGETQDDLKRMVLGGSLLAGGLLLLVALGLFARPQDTIPYWGTPAAGEPSPAPVEEPDLLPDASLPTLGFLQDVALEPPVEGSLLEGVGLTYWQTLGEWRWQKGYAFGAHAYDPVVAVASGVVSQVREDPIWGKGIVLQLGQGWEVAYWGLATVQVVEGETVVAGMPVGTVAPAVPARLELGPHVYIEVRRDGEAVEAAFRGR